MENQIIENQALGKLVQANHLTLEEKGILLTILSDDFRKNPLVKELPSLTHISRPTVLKILNKLREKGIIKNEVIFTDGRHRGFTWEINL